MGFFLQMWWELKNDNGVWAKYVNNLSWERSCMRHRLQQVAPCIEKHIRVLVCNGTSSFWFSNWLGSGPLQLQQSELRYPELSLCQAYVDGVWKLSLFEEEFSPSQLEQVMENSLIFISANDFLVWDATALGEFTLKSAYELVRL